MNDRSVYPLGKRRTLIVFFGLMLGMLLAALDQTIVSTALSQITHDLGGFDQEVASLSGGGVVTNSGASDARLTTGGSNASTTFYGRITDGAMNKTALAKVGAGTLSSSLPSHCTSYCRSGDGS